MGSHRRFRHHTDLTQIASLKLISRAVFAALLYFGIMNATRAQAETLEKHPLTFVTASSSHTITVEIADTEEKRSKGLMFRLGLADDEGMIFIYDEEQTVTMWMKNTYISLDMIFVRKNGLIHRIARNTEPFSEAVISSESKVLAVIEMKAGSAQRLGLKPGDRVDYPAFR